jgi:uncharacterized protein
MIIDLRDLQLRDEPLEIEALFTDEELSVSSRVAALLGVVNAHVTVRRSGDCVRVKGGLEANLLVTCSRCAAQFPSRVAKSFSLEYWPDPRLGPDTEELELKYADLDIGFYRNEELDLSAVVSEQIVLEVPMKPMCRDNCKGLCDQCGADLNLGDCGCSRNRIDPRLAPLAVLQKRRN